MILSPPISLAILLAAGLADGSGHAGALQAEPSEKSQEIRVSTLLVRVTQPAKFIGFPAACPGDSAENRQDGSICMAELYQAKVKVLRRVDGPATERNLTVRFTAHSFHAVWQRDVRFLLEVVPFDEKGATGHLATYWDWENQDAEFCKAEDSLDSAALRPVDKLYLLGRTRIATKSDNSWSEGSKLKCISGDEITAR